MTRIAIVGAGIGGLTAALALAQRGFSVEVFERAQAFEEVGAGLQLGPNATQVLVALGLRDALASRASTPPAVQFIDGVSGRDLMRLPLGDVIAARHGAPFYQIHRADLLAILAKAIEAHQISIQFNAEVVSIGEGALRLISGEERTYDAVIGADGARSKIYRSLVPGNDAVYSGKAAYRALVPGDDVPPETRVWLAPGRHLVSYPLRGGLLVNLVAIEDRDDWVAEDWDAAGSVEHLRQSFGQLPGPAQALLERVETTHLWGLYERPARLTYCAGAAVFVGDAVHPMLPFMAQGAGMAIEDAWVLAASVADLGVEAGVSVSYTHLTLPTKA